MSLLLALVGEVVAPVLEVKRRGFWLPVGNVDPDEYRKSKKELKARIASLYEEINGVQPSRRAVYRVVRVASKRAVTTYPDVSTWFREQERVIARLIREAREKDDEEALMALL